jgi:hypothetical protein
MVVQDATPRAASTVHTRQHAARRLVPAQPLQRIAAF